MTTQAMHEDDMTTITPRGYDFSGLPSYGTDDAGRVYCRPYHEYCGRPRNADLGIVPRSLSQSDSDWTPTGRRLDLTALAALSVVAQGVACAHGIEAGRAHDRIEGERLARIRAHC